jgi:hypothetical protein
MSLSTRLREAPGLGNDVNGRKDGSTKEKSANHARRQTALDALRQRMHSQLIEELGPVLYDRDFSEKELKQRVTAHLRGALANDKSVVISAAERNQLMQDVADDVLGYGPIEPFLSDPTISEIMVKGPRTSTSSAKASCTRWASPSSTRPTSVGSSTRSSPASAGASTSRRRWSTPVSPTAPASTR